VEIAIGIAFAIAMVTFRVALDPIIGERVPYALNFVAIVLATVAAGWRSGFLALTLSQLLIWYVVVPERWSFAFQSGDIMWAFVVATFSEAVILLIIALYQREIDKGVAEREQRMALLDHALNEIDHRTRNNHQTVLAMIHLQAQRSTHDGVREALHQVADRIHAIAQATERLALRSGNLERIRLDDHLCGLCEHIERGLSRQNVNVRCEVEEITTSADMAIPIAIIVNELVTNALKHAFDGRDQGDVLVTGRMNGALRLTVTDNGVGIRPDNRKDRGGLGTKLVENFARQLGAQHEIVSSEQGTTHDLVIPKVA
jgi:two-component system, sensor histidine kinase PdtaS